MADDLAEVFVSYKAEDRSRLAPLVDALEAEGFTVWWDARISGGANWHEDIERHLESAKCVIVAWSKRSIGHDGHFVRDEARRAQRRDAYLPVCIDAVEPPLGFGEIQALPLKGWHGDRSDPRFVAVADAVRGCVIGKPGNRHQARQEKAGVSRRAVVGTGVGIGAAAVAAAGGWLVLRAGPANASRIAVLPFENLSTEREQSYFAEGVAEEVRAALSRIGLQVIGRNSCEAVKDLDIETAAAKLDVANILTGSVRRSPDTIRINAQLVSGADGVERWGQSYDRAPGDAIKIQADIAANVAQALSVALGHAGRAALTIGGTSNSEAQDFLLRAAAIPGRDDSGRAILATVALIDRAIALDPNYAEAHARRSQYVELWASEFATSVKEKERGVADATRSAQRAIEIAPRMSLGYGALGGIHQDQLELRQSLLDFQRADSLPGVEVVTLAIYALVLSQSRRPREALSMIERAIGLDPLNPLAPELKGLCLFNDRQYEAALAPLRRALELNPGRIRSTSFLGCSLFKLGRIEDARRTFQQLPQDDYRRFVADAIIAAHNGRRDNALKSVNALERHYGDAAVYQVAQVYAQAGAINEAVRALEMSWEKRDPGLASIQVDPFLDPVRGDERVSAITARVFG